MVIRGVYLLQTPNKVAGEWYNTLHALVSPVQVINEIAAYNGGYDKLEKIIDPKKKPAPVIIPKATDAPKIATTAAPKIATTAAPKIATTAAPKIATTAAPKIATTAAPKIAATAAPKIATTAVPKITLKLNSTLGISSANVTTTQPLVAQSNSTNISTKNSALMMPLVAETPSILIYSLGAVGAAFAVTVAAYPFTCWIVDGLVLRKKNWLQSPLIRVQQFFAWYRGKNKTVESSIEMDSCGDNKAEEGDSFINEGDEHVSAKKQKSWVWEPIISAQRLYGWCRGKNKAVKSSIDMDSNGDEKAEEDNSFLNEGDEHGSVEKMDTADKKLNNDDEPLYDRIPIAAGSVY